MNQTACGNEWEFVLPMTIMLASITNSLNIFLGVDMYTELFLSLAFTLNCTTIVIADLRLTVIFGSKLHFACFPPLVIFCRWAHPVQARESGAGTPPFRLQMLFHLLFNIIQLRYIIIRFVESESGPGTPPFR